MGFQMVGSFIKEYLDLCVKTKEKGIPEIEFKDILRLAEMAGFEISNQPGSHVLFYHEGLVGWSKTLYGKIVIPKIHGGKSNPKVKRIYLLIFCQALDFLRKEGFIGKST